jgi:hypothetical protein
VSRATVPATTKGQRDAVRPVSRPHDAAEREADRAANVVAGGGNVRGWSFTSTARARQAADPTVHRQDTAAKDEERTDRDAYAEAAAKVGEALLETEAGKELKRRIIESPPVQKLKAAATTPAGIAVGLAAVAGGATGLALAEKPLPFQPPSVPLDVVRPGLSLQVKVEGPLNAPTYAGLTITYAPKAKPKPTTPAPMPGPVAPVRSAAEEAQLSQAAIDYVVQQQANRFTSQVPVMQLELLPRAAGSKRTEEEGTPVQRAAETASATGQARARVDTGIAGSGRPLTASVRHVMEPRFGHDFSAVRLHGDAGAAAAAASVDARAFTVGHDIVASAGTDLEASPRLLAHELAHVVQHDGARGSAPRTVHREPRGGSSAVVEPTDVHRRHFVDESIAFLQGSAARWEAVAAAANVPAPPQAPARAGTEQAPAASPTDTRAPGTPGQARRAEPPARLDPERLRTVLRGLLDTYEGSRRILQQQLAGDTARQERLQAAYVSAVEAARRAAVATSRVDLVLIAAPRTGADAFIDNATTYAQLYFGRSAAGEAVQQVTAIDSPAALLDAIEAVAPERMMGRIDIFAHGTIEPTHQIRFGDRWYSITQIEAVVAARARSGATLQNQTRFDGSTVIELHACRLGAAESEPGDDPATPTSGEDFLGTVGRAAGGERGQTVIGYEQRWAPRRYEFPGVRSTAEVGTRGRRAAAFDRIAVRTWDAVMAGSVEGNSQLTDAERQPGATISRERKIEIMRRLFDAAGGAWIIGYQYSGTEAVSRDPVRDVRRDRDTFSNEADWERHVLRVTVPPRPQVTP